MAPPRFFSPDLLAAGERALGGAAARHARVLRLDEGEDITLFDGQGGEWSARVLQTRKDTVVVHVLQHTPVERESALAVHLAVGMPTNDRMDDLIEKATELGAASVQPLITERSVLRLQGERAAKKVAHWQGIAVAACEQCGRNRVPAVHAISSVDAWLARLPAVDGARASRWLLSPSAPTSASISGSMTAATSGFGDSSKPTSLIVLSGPEGGLSTAEEARAIQFGFDAVQLGARVLRADTAPLAALVTAMTLAR